MISESQLSEISLTRLSRWRSALGLASGLVGLAVLLGWMINEERLKRLFPGLVSMNPLTALCFVVVGGSICLGWRRDPVGSQSANSRLLRFTGWFVLGVGLLSLVNNLFDGAWGIDQILFREKLRVDIPSHPNRMAPNTALSFALLGVGFLCLDKTTRQGRRPSEFIALVLLFNSFLALLGYAYQARFFYGMGSFIPMALHTAIVFFLLGLALLLARPQEGFLAVVTGGSPAGVLARRLFPAMVLTLALLGWVRLEAERAGIYGAEVGVTLYTAANIVIAGSIILWGARSLHRAETLRARTDQERERFFSLSLDLLCVADVNGRFRRVNPAFTSTFGFSREEIMERPLLDFVHPEDRAATMAAAEKLKQGSPSEEWENRYKCRNGGWKWIAWKAQPFLEENLVYSTGRDITERKAGEEELRKARYELEDRVRERTADLSATEAKFRALVEQSIVGIYVIQDGRLVYVNPKMTDIFGYTPDELTSRPVTSLMIEEDRERAAENIRKRMEGIVQHIRYSIRMRHKDGSLLYVEAFGSRSTYNGRTAILGTLLDITEQKEAEMALNQLNLELERRVQERTQALESANKELEAFSYSVSHDLRAPLRHVNGYVQLLGNATKGKLEPKAERFLRMIAEASVEMGHLIDDLLSFSRMSRVEVREGVVNLDELVKTTIASFDLIVKDRAITWNLGRLPAVKGDSSLLRQVLANLLGNAVKYTRDRTPAQIEVGCRGEDQDRLVFFVRDNGAGFDMSYAHKLFGVFQRLHSSEEFEGTGIGLAIVRRIIDRHGGRAWAEGTPNQGATFYFTLKAAETEQV